jgi:hypothetical protein
MKRTLRTLLAAVALAVGLLAAGATPSPAATGPLLSGRIVNGVWSPGARSFVEYWITGPTLLGSVLPSPHCDAEPDCATWVASGCSPALAGRDPAWASSIEKVSHLADGSTPRFFSSSSSFRWGVLTIQLWDRGCTEIGGGWVCGGWAPTCNHLKTRIPKGAVWMTIVSGGDNANTTWTLR